MAQFDVYRNPSPARDGFPYVVDIQHRQLNALPTRLVLPLQRLPRPPQDLPRRLVHTIDVEGEPLYLAAQQCAAVPARLLRKPVTSVAARSAMLLDALDAVVSGV